MAAGGVLSHARDDIPIRSAVSLATRTVPDDVSCVPGAPCFSGTPDSATLRLSFTARRPDEIALGLERLADAFGSV